MITFFHLGQNILPYLFFSGNQKIKIIIQNRELEVSQRFETLSQIEGVSERSFEQHFLIQNEPREKWRRQVFFVIGILHLMFLGNKIKILDW